MGQFQHKHQDALKNRSFLNRNLKPRGFRQALSAFSWGQNHTSPHERGSCSPRHGEGPVPLAVASVTLCQCASQMGLVDRPPPPTRLSPTACKTAGPSQEFPYFDTCQNTICGFKVRFLDSLETEGKSTWVSRVAFLPSLQEEPGRALPKTPLDLQSPPPQTLVL